MKSILFLSIILSAFTFTNSFSNDSISITYIANCGFLVEVDSTKIIIDGLFKRGHNKYPTPDLSSQKQMVSNQYPFNDIDLILVSHVHEDHFDKDMVVECMVNSPDTRLLCQQQVIDSLKTNTNYSIIKSRIINKTPLPNTSEYIQMGNIEIYACRFLHPGERHKNVQNIAYLITINGITIFHSADIDPKQIDTYRGITLNEMDIDIAFINEDFSKIEYVDLVRNYINAKHNIAMHLLDDASKKWVTTIKEHPDLYVNPYYFGKKMEKKTFYIE